MFIYTVRIDIKEPKQHTDKVTQLLNSRPADCCTQGNQLQGRSGALGTRS